MYRNIDSKLTRNRKRYMHNCHHNPPRSRIQRILCRFHHDHPLSRCHRDLCRRHLDHRHYRSSRPPHSQSENLPGRERRQTRGIQIHCPMGNRTELPISDIFYGRGDLHPPICS